MMWTDAELEQEILELKKEIKKAAVSVTSRYTTGNSALEGISPSNLLLHTITDIQRYKSDPKYIQYCRVAIYFRPNLIKRPSLYPEGYPNGVDNIIALKTNGWDYRRNQFNQVDTKLDYHGSIYGTWHGKFPVFAKSFSYPLSDMFVAASNYNLRKLREERPIHAQLSAKYMTVYGVTTVPGAWYRSTTPVGISFMNIGLNFDFK